MTTERPWNFVNGANWGVTRSLAGACSNAWVRSCRKGTESTWSGQVDGMHISKLIASRIALFNACICLHRPITYVGLTAYNDIGSCNRARVSSEQHYPHILKCCRWLCETTRMQPIVLRLLHTSSCYAARTLMHSCTCAKFRELTVALHCVVQCPL